MTSDHDQPPASGEPPTPRLRPRTSDPTADEVAPGPVRTDADTGEGTPPEAGDHGTSPTAGIFRYLRGSRYRRRFFVRHLAVRLGR